MREDQRKEKRQVCRYILRHLIDNPNAGDTLEGIVGWWLPQQQIKFETLVVAQALVELIENGLVVEQRCPDARVVYRANSGGENIQAILNEMRSLSDD